MGAILIVITHTSRNSTFISEGQHKDEWIRLYSKIYLLLNQIRGNQSILKKIEGKESEVWWDESDLEYRIELEYHLGFSSLPFLEILIILVIAGAKQDDGL